MNDERLNELYKKYWSFNSIMLEEYSPMEIAGVMMAQTMSIYKTLLTEDEFNSMVDTISNNRDQVRKLDQGPIFK